MAHPSKVKLGFTDSVKLDNYQYLKPYIEIEVTLNVGDNFVETVDKAKEHLRSEVLKLREEIKNGRF